jgi:hypothetical protein
MVVEKLEFQSVALLFDSQFSKPGFGITFLCCHRKLEHKNT